MNNNPLRTILSCIMLCACCLQLNHCALALLGGGAAGALVIHDRRTPAVVLEDKNIEMHAFKIIQDLQSEYKGLRAVPMSYNQHLLVVGQAPNEAVRLAVDQRLSQIAHVHKLLNELQIGEIPSVKIRNNDSWITTQIKSQLLMDAEIDSTHVKVLTEDGIVYLMGAVHPSEKPIAIDIAQSVRSVDKVVSFLQVSS